MLGKVAWFKYLGWTSENYLRAKKFTVEMFTEQAKNSTRTDTGGTSEGAVKSSFVDK